MLFNIFGLQEKISQSLKSKLIVTFLVIGLLPMLMTGGIALWESSNSLTNEAYAKLESLRDSKKQAIEDYGTNIINQVLTLSSSREIAKSINRINYAYDAFVDETQFLMSDSTNNERIETLRSELGNYYRNQFLPVYKESNDGQNIDVGSLLSQLSDEAVALQHAYIQDNPAALGNKHEMTRSSLTTTYDKAHEMIHPMLRQYLEAFGYYDIFLVDSEKGRVIYSVFKELDFATNLNSGPYADSGLAKAFKAGNKLTSANEFALLDYAQYTPSYEAPASFISSPVFDRGKKVGVLIFQMPLDRISSIMNTRSGLGETGEAYLVGADNLMRSDSFKNNEALSVAASFRNKEKANSEAIDNGLSNQTGVFESENYAGDKVISGYTSIKFGSLDWALVVDIESAEAFAALYTITWEIIGMSLIVAVVLLFFAIRFSAGIVRPISAMKETMSEIASSGDFNQRVEVYSKDEIGQSASSFNNMLESVGSTINEVNGVVGGLASGNFSHRVSANVNGDLDRLKQGVNESATSIEKTVGEVNDVVTAIAAGDFTRRVNADLQGDLGKMKHGVNNSADAVANSMSELSRLMEAMSKGDFTQRMGVELSGEYEKFGERADFAMQTIDDALKSIDSVMNSISSGNLDARVNETFPGQLDEIKQHINNSLSTLTEVFSGMGRVLSAMASGDLGESIEYNFDGVFESLKADANTTVNKLTTVVMDIRRSADNVRAGAEDIAQGNSNLSHRTEQQAANLEQTAASMDEITSTVQHTAENANRASELAIDAREQAQRGGSVVNEAVDAMQEINEASSRIAEIIGVIDEIAFQTNLLALNASVEAARAGEQGRGFAVVASEVRNLAGRSATAAKEIKDLIEDSVAKVQAGSDLVSKSGETLKDIVTGVGDVTNIVGEIATAADEQSIGISEVHKAVAQLQTLTQQNTAMVEEAAAASEELGGQARGLNDLVDFFANVEHGNGHQSTKNVVGF